MATTYLELKQKAEKMLAEAEQMRQKEIEDVIADIRLMLELTCPSLSR